MVKNLPANAGDTTDPGSIPGLGKSPGGGNGNPLFSNLAWKILWTEERGGLQSMGSQSRTRLSTHTHTHTHIFCSRPKERNQAYHGKQGPFLILKDLTA